MLMTHDMDQRPGLFIGNPLAVTRPGRNFAIKRTGTLDRNVRHPCGDEFDEFLIQSKRPIP
ncbi:hypothetical protein D3C71_1733550 [compost metagenome]